jgi:hypothetical protein
MSLDEHIKVDIEEDFKPVWDRGLLGAGTVIAVPDTGAGPATREYAASLAARGLPDIPFGQIETIEVPGSQLGAWDDSTHAHEVMRRILFSAPAALVLDLPVFRPSCPPALLQQAMDIAVKHDADLLNLSLGAKVPVAEIEAHYKQCPICHQAEALVSKHDIAVVAAAGNWAHEGIACPALCPTVILVSAVLAPEEEVWYRRYPQKAKEDFFAGRSGTSYAAALQTGLLALLRSAFPGITAPTWNGILSASTAFGRDLGCHAPLDLFEYVREISGGDYVNSVQWRELRTRGIKTRRQLLGTRPPSEAGEIAEVWDLLALQRKRSEQFTVAALSYAEGVATADARDTLSRAVDHFRFAAEGFGALLFRTSHRLRAMTAAALLSLGAALCFRAKLPQNRINFQDVHDANRALTGGLELLDATEHSHKAALEGAILSWRARVLTLSAEMEPGANDRAIEDARRALSIFADLPKSPAVTKDLAHAHLHLARAYFFKAHSGAWSRGKYFRRARFHAGEALVLGGIFDGYTKTEGEWLFEHSR